jgi:DNA invertase Pin-like site-specific DNA recombinase
VARQEQDARRLCERLGWDIVNVFTDNDISAFSGKARPGYKSLLDALHDRTVDAVVAWHPDRLHRSPRELETFIDAVEAAQAEVATVSAGDLDLSSANGRMVARIAGAVARHESEHKSERIRRKHLELAENGKVPGGGRRPFGYNADRRTIREDEAEHIRDAAARILAGDSLRSVVADWNTNGVPSVTGTSWSSTTLKRLLLSGRVSGQREHHGDIVSVAEWPGIISPDQTARLRVLLSDQRRNRAAGVDARTYLLTGFLYCGRCGVRMTSRANHVRGHKYPRYICSADRGGCGRCGVHAPRLEHVITEAVLTALDTPKMAKTLDRRRRHAAKTTPVDEIADVEMRQVELAEAFGRREVTMAEWRAAKKALDTDLERLRSKVVEQTQAIVLLPDAIDLRVRWDDVPLDRRRQIIAAVIERIDIAPTERANNRFDASRIAVRWRA